MHCSTYVCCVNQRECVRQPFGWFAHAAACCYISDAVCHSISFTPLVTATSRRGRRRRCSTPTPDLASRAAGKRLHVRPLQKSHTSIRLEDLIKLENARSAYLISVVPVVETLVRVTSVRRGEKDSLVLTDARQLVAGVSSQEIHINGGTVCPLPVTCRVAHQADDHRICVADSKRCQLVIVLLRMERK